MDGEDVDVYRNTTRNELRDWIKDHATVSSNYSSTPKQETHDAFEWLIVHVTLPQGRGLNASSPSGIARGDSEAVKKSSSLRWSSKSSTSVIEKIRSDFNGTSKSAIDRVAQVRVTESEADYRQADSTSHDCKTGWDDLVAKLKSLILASFNLRVQQYEEDIKEKELQRNFPGWNFNTFFVLKEGLARGFESVGLVEDALSSYHELATSLNAVIDEQLQDQAPEKQTTRFSEYTDDLRQAYIEANRVDRLQRQGSDASSDDSKDLGAAILDTERKAFRDLILENNISIFDFQGYVFARQVSLLLRLANAAVPKESKANTTNGNAAFQDSYNSQPKPSNAEAEDLLMLADVCQLSLNYITSATWIIRRDLAASLSAANKDYHESSPSGMLHDGIVENVVASWTFSACCCILTATSARSLSLQVDPPLRRLENTALQTTRPLTEEGQDGSIAEPNLFPRRTYSLSFQSPSTHFAPSQKRSASTTPLDTLRSLSPGTPHPGFQELAAQRGELLSLSRRTLSGIAFRCKAWKAGFSGALKWSGQQNDEMEDIDLSLESEQNPQSLNNTSFSDPIATTSGTSNTTLKSALRSRESFLPLYEGLTKAALAHHIVGDRIKMVEAMTADLAVLFFQRQDHSVAASYFKQLASVYNDKDWISLGTTMLDMWAQCLQGLDNVKEHIAVALRALASGVSEMGSTLSSIWSFNKLISASSNIDEKIAVPLDHYFLESELHPYVSHYPDQDGFRADLRLRWMLREKFSASSIRVRIISLDNEHRSNIWLSSEKAKLVPGLNSIEVGSKVCCWS